MNCVDIGPASDQEQALIEARMQLRAVQYRLGSYTAFLPLAYEVQVLADRAGTLLAHAQLLSGVTDAPR
jgi:hypothetical protein